MFSTPLQYILYHGDKYMIGSDASAAYAPPLLTLSGKLALNLAEPLCSSIVVPTEGSNRPCRPDRSFDAYPRLRNLPSLREATCLA